jgi:formylmethanofuran dehydrogenase subunit E
MPFAKGYVPKNNKTESTCCKCGKLFSQTPRQKRKGEYLCPVHKLEERRRYQDLPNIRKRLKVNAPLWRSNPANRIKQQSHYAAANAIGARPGEIADEIRAEAAKIEGESNGRT